MKRAVSVRARRGGACAASGLALTRGAAASPQVARESLISLGVTIGKFTHSNKFILTIGALDILAQHAKYKARRPSVARAWLRAACSARRCETLSVFKPSSHEPCGLPF